MGGAVGMLVRQLRDCWPQDLVRGRLEIHDALGGLFETKDRLVSVSSLYRYSFFFLSYCNFFFLPRHREVLEVRVSGQVIQIPISRWSNQDASHHAVKP